MPVRSTRPHRSARQLAAHRRISTANADSKRRDESFEPMRARGGPLNSAAHGIRHHRHRSTPPHSPPALYRGNAASRTPICRNTPMTDYVPIEGTFAIFASLCGFGLFLDTILRDDIKRLISSRLTRTTFDNRELSSLFRSIFDHVFDTRKYRRPRLIRSFCASYIFFLTLVAIWSISYADLASSIPTRWDNIAPIIFFILIINPVGDFFSLWQTRIIVEYLANVQKKRYFLPLLVLDFFLTILIFGIAATLWRELLNVFISLLGYQTGGMFYLKELYCRYTFTCSGSGMVFTDATVYSDIIFLILFTTMLTSIWLWVFVVGILLWTTLGSAHKAVAFGWINRLLNVEKYPVSVAMALGGLPLAPLIFFFANAGVAYFRG